MNTIYWNQDNRDIKHTKQAFEDQHKQNMSQTPKHK